MLKKHMNTMLVALQRWRKLLQHISEQKMAKNWYNNLQSLEATVNNELKNVCDWLTANKLTLNTKKSNFVIFRPRQKKLVYEVNLNVIDNNTNTLTSLECKEYVKYLGVLIDSHLSWKFHIDYVASKLSKIVGIIARLRHFVPFNTLLSIYQSLMFPYLTFGLSLSTRRIKVCCVGVRLLNYT